MHVPLYKKVVEEQLKHEADVLDEQVKHEESQPISFILVN